MSMRRSHISKIKTPVATTCSNNYTHTGNTPSMRRPQISKTKTGGFSSAGCQRQKMSSPEQDPNHLALLECLSDRHLRLPISKGSFLLPVLAARSLETKTARPTVVISSWIFWGRALQICPSLAAHQSCCRTTSLPRSSSQLVLASDLATSLP